MLYIRILTHLSHGHRERAEEIWTCVKNRYKFPKVIGSIDCTHVKIAAPKVHPDAYTNWKGYNSIQLQVYLKLLQIY